jgi:hypothetical protein
MEATAGEQELCFVQAAQFHSHRVAIDGSIQD